MIPTELHRTVPAEIDVDVELRWLHWQETHPRWSAYTWRDPLDAASFPISSHVWPHVTSGAQLAGLVRLEVLYHRGGIYLDSDVDPGRRTLDALREVGPVWVCSEDGRHLTDAVIGAEHEHPAVRRALDRAVQMIEVAVADGEPVPGAQATGPLNLTEAWRGRDDVTVLAARCFYPYSYTQRDEMADVDALDWHDSFGVHRWAFSWNGT